MSCCQMIVAAARAGINRSKCLHFSGGCGGRQREKLRLCRYTGLGRGHGLLEKTWISVWLFPLLSERRTTSTKPGCQNFWWQKRIRTKERAAMMWKGLDFHSVFSHVVQLHMCASWVICRSGTPLIVQTFCVWLLLEGPFALNPGFRKLCRKYLKGKTNSWIWAVCSWGIPWGSHPEVASCGPT